jgi:4-diphosphocytidyl-2-C-methyl-D-erythritol kinase
MFRLIEQAHGLPDNWEEIAARLGADVPSCVRSEMAIGRGTGTDLEPVENDLEGTAVLLINPRIPLPTGPVFKAWDGMDRGALPDGPASNIARHGRNDLHDPAIKICPQIADVLEELSCDAPFQFEMSGSGATCFALYQDTQARDDAAIRIASAHPEWWQLKGNLRR